MSATSDSLSRALDHAIGEGPALPPVTDHLVPGRRALRRRRAAAGLGVAVAVAVLGTTVAVSGDAAREAIDVPAASTSPTPNPIRTAGPGQLLGEDAAGYTVDNDILVRPGTEVVTRIWAPLSTPPGTHTDSFSQRADGQVHYYLNYWEDAGGSCGTSATSSAEFPTLESWLAHEAGLMDTPGWPWVGQCASPVQADQGNQAGQTGQTGQGRR